MNSASAQVDHRAAQQKDSSVQIDDKTVQIDHATAQVGDQSVQVSDATVELFDTKQINTQHKAIAKELILHGSFTAAPHKQQ